MWPYVLELLAYIYHGCVGLEECVEKCFSVNLHQDISNKNGAKTHSFLLLLVS